MSESGNYVTPGNLLARIAIHDYALNKDWTRWLFEREMPERHRPARILDIGCGTASLWAANRHRIDPEWVITLVDSSQGMTGAAGEMLGDRASYVVADIQELPFEDDSFDTVLANHMLYHVHDRPRAFREVARVLSPGGAFHCSTNGRGHLRELSALQPESMGISEHTEAFGLETGPPQLAANFVELKVQQFDNSLAVPSAEPVLAYICSSERFAGEDLSAARQTVEAEIAQAGVFTITTRPGLISCRNPSVHQTAPSTGR